MYMIGIVVYGVMYKEMIREIIVGIDWYFLVLLGFVFCFID